MALAVTSPSSSFGDPVGGPLGLVVEPTGAEVLVDGRRLGTVPMPPIRLEPGLHTLVISAPGYRSVTRTLELRARTEVTLAVVLEPLPGRSGRLTRATTERHSPRRRTVVRPVLRSERRTSIARARGDSGRIAADRARSGTPLGRGPLLWTGFGLTIAMAGAAVLTGSLALSAESDYRDPDASDDERRFLHKKITRLQTATDILVDGAIVLGLATVALFLLAGPDDDGRATASGKATHAWQGGLGAVQWTF